VVGFFGVVAGTDVKSAPTKVEAAKATVGLEKVVLGGSIELGRGKFSDEA